MTSNTLNVASAIASTTHALNFGKAQKASAKSIDALAEALLKEGIKPSWIPTDSFNNGSPIHLETYSQIADGLLPPKRADFVKNFGKEFVNTLSAANKKQRETDCRQVRRLTMVLLTQVVFVMGGGKAADVDAKRKAPKTEWHADEKRMAALMALHDSASGTDKTPQQQYELEFQQLLKPAVDFLRSKSSAANKIHSGYGQQYKGSFSIKKTK